MKICAICGNLLEMNFFSNFWVVWNPRQWIFSPGFLEWFVPTIVIVCGFIKKNLEFAIWWKNTHFMGAFISCLREELLVSFFSTFWRNIYWFLMVGTGSKCLVDIWKRVHKKSEASDVFSSWCFFGLNEVAFFLMFAVCFIKFLMYWNFFALNGTKSPYTFVNRHSLISWSPKEGN